MIRRSFDSADINPILNHPAVLPWVALPGETNIDTSDLIADPKNVLLMGDRCGFIFHWHEPGIYEIHSQALPAVRGSAALRSLRDALDWMFINTDCMEILTKCPVNNRAAIGAARFAGATLEFIRQKAWPTPDGPVAVWHYALRYPEWVRNALGLVEKGHWFHNRLTAEKARTGSEAAIHDDDVEHDRRVGACALMIFAGQPGKGVILFNRWARFSGYATVDVVGVDPLLIDIREGIIKIGADDFELVTGD